MDLHNRTAGSSLSRGGGELLMKLSDFTDQSSPDKMIPLVEKVLSEKKTTHQKQLSADSTSPRMKNYNFNSNPNLRPKSLTDTLSRSTPTTPDLSAATNRRRKPPPPPLAITTTAAVLQQLHNEVEVKTLRPVGSYPLLQRQSNTVDLTPEPESPIPIPKPRRRRTNPTGKMNTVQSNETSPAKTSATIRSSTPTQDPGDPVVNTIRRRAPPLPPSTAVKNTPITSTNTDHTDGDSNPANGDTSTKDKQTATPPESSPGKSFAKSYNPLQTMSPPNGMPRPPGVLFTPPPSRSHSLQRSIKQSHFFPAKRAELTRNNTLTPALSKPLPPIPSLTKPLPPLPSPSLLAPSPTTDNDYAYISDSPERVSSPSLPTSSSPRSQQQSSSLDEYVQMSDADRLRITLEDQYLSMTGNIDTSQHHRRSSDVFTEDTEYISMLPGQSTSKPNEKGLEDEYVKMSGSCMEEDLNPNQLAPIATTLSSSINAPFGYSSMYIDLDMIRESVVALAQNDTDAKHPKSRFSISSSSTATSPPPSDSGKYGKSVPTKPSPKHTYQDVSSSQLTPVVDIDEIGIYTTIPDTL